MKTANFAYSQRGINRAQAVELVLSRHGRVSIIWSRVPKAHLKTIKKLVENCIEEFVPEYTEGYLTTPEHYDYTLK